MKTLLTYKIKLDEDLTKVKATGGSGKAKDVPLTCYMELDSFSFLSKEKVGLFLATS